MIGLAPLAPVVRTSDHRYVCGTTELLGVTTVLKLAGLTNYDQPWFSEWHRDRGTAVHRMVALDYYGDLDERSLDPQLRGYLTGYRRFRAEVGGDIEFVEQLVHDVRAGVAGTLDLLVRQTSQAGPDVRTVFDIKPGHYAPTAIQLSAYARMARGLYDMPVTLRRAALVIPGDGSYQVVPCTEPTDEQTWLAAVRIAQWRRAHGTC